MGILQKLIIASLFLVVHSSNAADGSGGNSIYINQTNADNSTVSITQTGSNNTVGDPTSILSPAFVIEGNSMFLTIIQDGMNNALTGNLIGGTTTANITQTGNSNFTNFTMGNMGTSTGLLNMTMTGSNNTSLLNIGLLHDSSNYTYTALMTGSNNTLTSNINSKYVVDDFTVTGSNNAITTTQTGANGTNRIVGNNIAISAIGNSNSIEIMQDATTNPNSVIVNLSGNNVGMSIIQH